MKHLLLALSALLVLGTVACSKKGKDNNNNTNTANQCYNQTGYNNGYGNGYGNGGYNQGGYNNGYGNNGYNNGGYNQNPNCVNGGYGQNSSVNAVCQRLWSTHYPHVYQPQYNGDYNRFLADCVSVCTATPQVCAGF